jgi:hypothetical protein
VLQLFRTLAPHATTYKAIMQPITTPTSAKGTYHQTNTKSHQSSPLAPTTPPAIHHPPTKPTMPFDALLVPAYRETDNDDHDDTIPSWPTLPAIRFHFPQGPTNIAPQALYHIINLGFTTRTVFTIPQALYKSYNCFHHIINIKEVCNGDVYPMTKETITKYIKLINNPDLKILWVPAISKEHHQLAQGKEGITFATNTIFFLSHEEIRHIPKDRTVTYTRIVVNYQPQKDDTNCIFITVGSI